MISSKPKKDWLPSNTPPELRLAYEQMGQKLKGLPGIVSWGLGNGTIRVMVQNEEAKNLVPKKIGTVRVEVTITGDFNYKN